MKKSYDEYVRLNDAAELVIVVGWPMLVPIVKDVTAGYKDTRVVSWLHGAVEVYEAEKLGDYEDISAADAHLAINNEIKKSLIAHLGEQALVYRTNNPVGTDDIVFSSERNTKNLVYVGRFSEEKNVGFLIEAFALAPKHWTLKLIGDGDESIKESLHKRCRELNLEERVSFLGWIENPWKEAIDSYALVLPSKRETMPLVAIEALLCGMPVIATPVDGIRELISPGVNGYLFPHDDKEAFARILAFCDDNRLPKISPKACRESVSFVLEDKPLKEFYEILQDISKMVPEDHRDAGKTVNGYFADLRKIYTEYLTNNYDMSYLAAMLKKYSLKGAKNVIVGSSHTMNGIKEELLPGGKKDNINLSSSSQDLFCDELHIKRVLAENGGALKSLIIELPYYVLYQDLSKSKKEGGLIDHVYYPIFGREALHNLNVDEPEEGVYWPKKDTTVYSEELVKGMCQKLTEEAFMIQSTYYGLLPREKGNALRLNGIYWENLTTAERLEYATKRADDHNKQRRYKESFNENKQILRRIADACHEANVRTVFVIMPHTAEYIEKIDPMFKEEIYAALEENDFFDPDPLNRSGAEKTSRMLAAYLEMEF